MRKLLAIGVAVLFAGGCSYLADPHENSTADDVLREYHCTQSVQVRDHVLPSMVILESRPSDSWPAAWETAVIRVNGYFNEYHYTSKMLLPAKCPAKAKK